MKVLGKYLVVVLLAMPFMCDAKTKQKARTVVVDMDNCQELQSPTEPFILVLRKGEVVEKSIVECVQRMGIFSASVSGIGMIENPEVGTYNLKKRHYNTKVFPGVYQLASLNGTVTTSPRNLVVGHMHCVFVDSTFRAYGGHLQGGTVGVTMTITIIPFPREIFRQPDHDIGLDLIDSKR